jgi:transmembrane 9 superfamily protein 2/4
VGYVGSDGLHYINNHLRIEVGYRPTSSGNHIVGFLVDPISFDHARAPLECAKGLDANSPGTAGTLPPSRASCCPFRAHFSHEDFPQQVEGPVTIKFTYDVFWEESSIPWTHRWDIYMSASVGDSIHWYSIINRYAHARSPSSVLAHWTGPPLLLPAAPSLFCSCQLLSP